MKLRFISFFIFFILLLAIAIGQCNDAVESDGEVVSFYQNNAEQEEWNESVGLPIQEDTTIKNVSEVDVESAQEETIEKKVGELDASTIVLLPPNIPSQIICRTAYSLSYNKDTRCPNWVAWYLTADHTDGEWGRSNDFREDYNVSAPRATNEDYRGSSWSRGHMCPAGDNKWSADAMSETFLLSNVCPQDRNLNSGLWNRIEMDCRKWARNYGGVYIVCGPLFYDKEHETIGDNSVAVPEAFFKVVLCLQGEPKAIGFVVKNNAGTKKKDHYVNTIAEVERLTGFNFFSALQEDVENEIEAYANLDDWR